MSTATATDLDLLDADAPRGRQASLRAFRGLMRLEWRRQLMTPRVLWPLLLALLPVGIAVPLAAAVFEDPTVLGAALIVLTAVYGAVWWAIALRAARRASASRSAALREPVSA